MSPPAAVVKATSDAGSSPLVGMGQVSTIKAPEVTRAVLGSCIGVALYHPRCKAGAFAHVVLANSAGREGMPGKYADTAVQYLIDLLRQEGTPSSGLVAKLTGGANMFGNSGPIQVGRDNATAVKDELEKRKIPVVAENLGGSKGRRISFAANDGIVTVEVAGEPPIEL